VYVRVSFGELGEVVAWSKRELRGLPFESVARRWRHEVYFEAPVEVEGEEALSVERGTFAYWKRGRALCLFHGYSQPYGPVVKLGYVVGKPDLLFDVEDGTPVRVSELVEYGRAGEVAAALREAGLKAASHTWGGEEVVGVLVEGVDVRIGAEVAVEEDGFYVETQALAYFDQAPATVAFYNTLVRELAPTGLRPDLSDEGYLTLTCFSRSLDELARDLRRLLAAYSYAEKVMEAFYGVRRPA